MLHFPLVIPVFVVVLTVTLPWEVEQCTFPPYTIFQEMNRLHFKDCFSPYPYQCKSLTTQLRMQNVFRKFSGSELTVSSHTDERKENLI